MRGGRAARSNEDSRCLLNNPPSHSWRDKWTALSRPLASSTLKPKADGGGGGRAMRGGRGARLAPRGWSQKPRQSRPDSGTNTTVKARFWHKKTVKARFWHKQDSQGQILALTVLC